MRKDNKQLYEHIMRNVAREVKRALNESLTGHDDELLDKFLNAVYTFCRTNGLGNNEEKYLIAAFTDEQEFDKYSKMADISTDSIDQFEDSLNDETYEYMTYINNGITYDMAYDRYCDLYR